MKLIQNEFDTVTNRLVHAGILFDVLHPDIDLAHAKLMLGRFEAQMREIRDLANALDLDVDDMVVVISRIEVVINYYLNPLKNAIAFAEKSEVKFQRFGVSRVIAKADSEFRCLRYTLELTRDTSLAEAC
jgi:hypothetical protein